MGEEQLSRRERQIMRVIYRLDRATVHQVHEGLDAAPSLNAVRTLIQILETKGHLRRKKKGREFIYSPLKNRMSAGFSELQGVLETFFGDSIEQALAAHLSKGKSTISSQEYDRLAELIEQARESEENKS